MRRFASQVFCGANRFFYFLMKNKVALRSQIPDSLLMNVRAIRVDMFLTTSRPYRASAK